MSSRFAPCYALPGLCFCFTDLHFGFAIFGVVFVSSHHRKYAHAKLSHNIHRSQHPPLPSSRFSGHWVLTRPPNYLERHHMFIHGTLLYLSLDGVIPEAFIYVYIPYNIS